MKTNSIFFGLLIFTALIATSAPALDQAWVISSDYTSLSRIQSFAGASPWTLSADLAQLPNDAVGRQHDGLVYVVGRGVANLIQIYDPQDNFALVREFSLGSGLNLQDIVFDTGNEAYVSCYDQAVLLRVDVVTEAVLATYSTTMFADTDGLPETSWMAKVGDRLLISCQLLDRDNYYAPTAAGQILVFDLINRQWEDLDDQQAGVQPLQLVGFNPYTPFEIQTYESEGPTLRVGCSGYYGMTDGGIEEVDLQTLTSNGFLVGEPVLGGDIIDFVSTDETTIYYMIADASFYTSVRRVDLTSGQTTVIHQASSYAHADVAWDGGVQLFVADRTLGQAGIRVFDVLSGAELTSGPIRTSLPPSLFVLPSVPVTPVPDPSQTWTLAGGPRLSAPWPNPCNPAADVQISAEPGQPLQVSVVDLRGRRVMSRTLQLDGTGKAIFRFTGQDDTGRSLAAGVYRVVAQSPRGLSARSVVLVK